MIDAAYPYVWYWRARLPERHRQPCRVLARGRMNSVLVQFPDGFLVVTSRYAVRRAENQEPRTENRAANKRTKKQGNKGTKR